jgi:hypothetical protein
MWLGSKTKIAEAEIGVLRDLRAENYKLSSKKRIAEIS